MSIMCPDKGGVNPTMLVTVKFQTKGGQANLQCIYPTKLKAIKWTMRRGIKM